MLPISDGGYAAAPAQLHLILTLASARSYSLLSCYGADTPLIIHHPSPPPPWQRCSRVALVCFLDERAPVLNSEGLAVDPALRGSPADVQMAQRDSQPDIAGLLFWEQVENF